MSYQALILLALVAYTHGHGRMTVPPNRASIWRYGYNAPANYDDDGLNCGGYAHQWYTNEGKCGVCGDAYDLTEPRPHELGGKYGLGYIVAEYSAGQVFSATIYLSVSHVGFWELRICTDPYNNEQECFDQHLLELEDGGTKYYPLDGSTTYTVNYRLPEGLQCDHCVLQWQYTAGNNWGVCKDGSQGLGCGNQEQFFTCSDISIKGNGELNVEPEEDSAGDTNDQEKDESTNDSNNNPELQDECNGDSNDVENEIDDSSKDSDDDEKPSVDSYIPVVPPILLLNNEGLLRLLMGNEIADDPPKKRKNFKYKNRHRRRSGKKNKRRKFKMMPWLWR